MATTDTDTDTVKARGRDTTVQPVSWTVASATTGGNVNIGPGVPRRVKITEHFPTFTGSEVKH